ncbi:MAG: hypothetical protein GXO78_09215 [Calditrichaeota bacterium]|nr:hypothetical protein [Calditrichota bacterium]
MDSRFTRYMIATLLMIAIADLPYGYYIFLRIAVTLVAITMANMAYRQKHSYWMMLFIAIAILFNPIIPVYLDKEIWIVIDLVVALLFIVSVFSLRLK